MFKKKNQGSVYGMESVYSNQLHSPWNHLVITCNPLKKSKKQIPKTQSKPHQNSKSQSFDIHSYTFGSLFDFDPKEVTLGVATTCRDLRHELLRSVQISGHGIVLNEALDLGHGFRQQQPADLHQDLAILVEKIGTCCKWWTSECR